MLAVIASIAGLCALPTDRLSSTQTSVATAASSSSYLSDLNWSTIKNGWGPVEKDKSNGEQAVGDGHILSIRGVTYAKGLGVSAPSEIYFNTAGNYATLTATVGVDDEVFGRGSVVFQVWADGTKLFDSGLMTGTSPGQPVSVNVTGKQDLRLVVTDGGDGFDYDHADWADTQLVAASLTPARVAAATICAGQIDTAFGPVSAYELPPSRRDELQQVLDTYKVVRLQRGNYRGALSEIRISSDEQLYGAPGEMVTIVPKLTIVPGTSNAVAYGLSPVSTEFPASSAVTQHNCFIRLADGDLTITGGTLDSNVFLDLHNIRIMTDTRSGGYVRNNRFIRAQMNIYSPAITMLGDAARQSNDNTFLMYNLLGVDGDGMYFDNQADVTLIGLNAEDWNRQHLGQRGGMITTGAMGTLRVLNAVGGPQFSTPIAQRTSIFDISADEFQLYNGEIHNDVSPEVVLRGSSKRSALLNVDVPRTLLDQAVGALRLQAFGWLGEDAWANGAEVVAAPLSATQQDALRTMFVNPATNRPGQPWERPTFGPVPDPAGPSWNVNLAAREDSTTYIQNLINTNGIARLPAGVYYISRPIKINNGQGIIGAGETSTAIVAKTPDFDMINSGTVCGGVGLNCNQSITLTDLTLQGGKNGVHWDAATAGTGATYTDCLFSHVTFRNMADSGLFVDGIMGLDNNFWDNLNFVNNAGAGLKQQAYTDGVLAQSYLDKDVFFHSQFIGNGRGLDLQAIHQNNSNAWINSLFQDNASYAADMRTTAGTIFANDDFINNGGSPTVKNDWWGTTSFVSAYFRADARGATMLGDNSTCEGCTFDSGTSSSAVIMAAGSRGFLYNSRSTGMPVGGLRTGLLFNTHWRPILHSVLRVYWSGTANHQPSFPAAPVQSHNCCSGVPLPRDSALGPIPGTSGPSMMSELRELGWPQGHPSSR